MANVKLPTAKAVDILLVLRDSAPQSGTDAGPRFSRTERLGDVIVGSHLQAHLKSDGGIGQYAETVKKLGVIDDFDPGWLAIVGRAKASMHFTVRVEWQRKDGTTSTAELVTSDHGPCESGGDMGLKLAEAKRILTWLQEIVVKEQGEYCEAARTCSVCGQRRLLKDNRQRRFYTVFGKITVKASRFHGCRSCQDQASVSPVGKLLEDRVSPELRYLQAKFAAQLPYRQAADLLRELLPETGDLNHATTRNRTLAIGHSLDQELCQEIKHPQVAAEPAPEMVVGIDGAFVKAIGSEIRPKQSLEILTGRVETTGRGGHAFAVVRNLDGQAKQRVQAILRRCGRGPETNVRILSHGEDGLRGVVGWFGKQCASPWIGFMCPEESKTSAGASFIFLGETIAMSGATIVGISTV